MSKIKKGMKILLFQGPDVFIRKLRDKGNQYKKSIKMKKRVRSIHMITEKQRKWQKNKVFENSIKFSIITPLYNTPKKYLKELIQSLEKQTYTNWELCLADGSDRDHAYVKEICRKWSRRDKRIIYVSLDENRGISCNTNACIELSSGEYLGLLDHDDILHESALFEMMEQISKTCADFLYSDEAKFSGKVKSATDFNFKAGFGKDELRSHNYICHFTVFKRELLEEIGEVYRPEFDGSQDHDMVLRLTEKANKIIHIPKILYYWRVHPESVSMNLDSKSYAVVAAIKAVQEQLDRTKEYGKVDSNLPYRTIYRVKYDINQESRIGIIVHGLHSSGEYEIFKERILDITNYQKLDFIPIIENKKQCLGKNLNRIIEQNQLDYFIIMDANCIPQNGEWVKEMLMYVQRRDVAVVSPKVLYTNNTIAYAGIVLDKRKKEKVRFLCRGISDSEQGYEAILRYTRNTTSGWKGCLMVKKRSVLELGGFSEELQGYEDVDFSLRAVEAGYCNVWNCFAEIVYLKEEIEDFKKGMTSAFSKKWSEKIIEEDPYYNNNWRILKLV